jgi:parallel beta-helix repeat protein
VSGFTISNPVNRCVTVSQSSAPTLSDNVFQGVPGDTGDTSMEMVAMVSCSTAGAVLVEGNRFVDLTRAPAIRAWNTPVEILGNDISNAALSYDDLVLVSFDTYSYWGNCEFVFTGNRLVGNSSTGGEMLRVVSARGTIANNLFAGNTSGTDSAIVSLRSGQYMGSMEEGGETDYPYVFRNNTLADNTTAVAALYNRASTTAVANCIFHENRTPDNDLANVLHADYGSLDIATSCIQDGTESDNLDADPLFVNPSGGDYHLQSWLGSWHDAAGAFVPDSATSSCIDAGAAGDSFANEPTPNGGRINLGAYGNTLQASMSYNASLQPSATELTGVEDSSLSLGVSLSAPVGHDVSVTFQVVVGTSLLLIDGSASASVTIPDSTYDTPQTVTISLVPDNEDANDQMCLVSLQAPGLPTKYVTVQHLDDDFELTLLAERGGSVSADTGVYAAGTGVSITATPEFGNSFDQWTGDTANVADVEAATTTVTMNANATLTATFDIPAKTYYVSTAGSDSYDGRAATCADGHGPKATIGAAIELCYDGDTVEVLPGTHDESIDFDGKDITVTGTDPADPAVVAATIVGEQSTEWEGGNTTAVTFDQGETNAAVLTGLTISTGNGRGIVCANGSSPTISRCRIVDNTGSFDQPAGIYSEGSPVIVGNLVTGSPTGIYLANGSAIVRNNVIVGNGSGSTESAGVYVGGGSAHLVESNTIAANDGTGVYQYGGSVTVTNSIVWGNSSYEILAGMDGVSVSYCCVEGGYTGTGTISDNPLFVDAANGNYHLQSVHGRWDVALADWTDGESQSSPCIDAGNPGSDYALEPEGNGSRLNLGAYGNTIEASRSSLVGPTFVLSADTLSVPEAGTAQLTVCLSEAPAAAVSAVVGIDAGSDTDFSITSTTPLSFDAGNYAIGQTITVAAAPDNGDADSGVGTLRVSADGVNRAKCTLTEADDDFTLTVSAGLGGSATPAGTSVYSANDSVPLVATAQSGYAFSAWVGDTGNVADASSASTSLTVLADTVLTATFESTVPTRYVSTSGDDSYNGLAPVWDGQDGPKLTIQSAINASSTGHRVIVLPGTYGETVDFGGLGVTVTGTNPDDASVVAATIIDAGMDNSGAVFQSGEDAGAVLRGFTVIGSGAAAIRCLNSSSPTIDRCVTHLSMGGVGVNCASGAAPTIVDCTIEDGTCTDFDSGIRCDSASPTIERVRIYGLQGAWGAIYLTSSNAIVRNCVIFSNGSESGGSGITIDGGSPLVENNTIAANSFTALYVMDGTPTVRNCIVWGNGFQVYDVSGGASVSYCCIQGGYPAGSNISVADPLFVDSATGDYHLQSVYGHWDDASADWAEDTQTSPCIDAGDPTSSYAEEPMDNGGHINLGAYGNTSAASLSGFPGPTLVFSSHSVSAPEAGTVEVTVRVSEAPPADFSATVAFAAGADGDLSVTGGASLSFTTVNYATPQTVTIAAAADGDADDGTGVLVASGTGVYPGSCTVTEADDDVVLTLLAGTGGSVSPSGTNVYAAGTDVQIVASPDPDCSFAGWTGDTTGVADSATSSVHMDADKTLTATFTPPPVTYYVSTSGDDSYNGLAETWQSGILGPKASIQAAIGQASTGDTVIVAQGTYSETVSFGGRNLTLTGTDPDDPAVVAATIISPPTPMMCGESTTTVTFDDAETGAAAIVGITITSGYGLGISCTAGSSPTIDRCLVRDNSRGGIHCANSSPAIVATVVRDNTGDTFGGIDLDQSSATVRNCVIVGNTASNAGGAGIRAYAGAPVVESSTIADNSGIGLDATDAAATLRNCIVWGNSTQVQNTGGSLAPSYCCIQGGYTGGTNIIDSSPLFVNAASDDYHLQSLHGHWDDSADDWVADTQSSPCIDAGDPSSDYVNEPANNGACINLGAYGNTLAASLSGPPGPTLVFTPHSVSVPEGGTAQVSVRVSAQPPADFTATVAFLSGADGSLSVTGGATLVFTTGNYDQDQTVTIAAATDNEDADDGTGILQATGSGVYAGTCAVTEADDDFTLTLLAGTGGTVSPAGTGVYASGVDVDIVATAAAGYGFSAWTGDTTGVANIAASSVHMDADRTLTATFAVLAQTYYVVPAPTGSDSYDGLSATVADGHGPKATILAAIGEASSGDTVVVAQGTYQEEVDFDSKNLTLTSTDPDDPAVVAATIISGGGDGGMDIPATGVTFSQSETADALLIGLTITVDYGYGIRCANASSPTISQCRILGGASYSCKGISCTGASCPTVTGCLISGNSMPQGTGIYLSAASDATIVANTITGNGGLTYGGIYCENSDPEIRNNLIVGNTTGDGDAAGLTLNNSDATLLNNTFAGNTGYAIYTTGGSPVLRNCIVWGDSYGAIDVAGGVPTVTYCCVQGGYSGSGNIDTTPLFVDAANGDYHLQSTAGSWHNGATDWTTDASTSPCIDAGHPTDPYGNESDPNGSRINMGAYGNLPEASLSPGP